jgi:hypothetical protein
VRGSGSLSKAVIVWRRVLNGSRERFEDMRTTPVFGCCFLANRRSAGRAAAIQRNGKFLPLWSRSALGTISHPVVHWWRCARKFPARTGFPFSGYSAAVINERVARKIRSRSIWHAYVTCVLMRVSKVGFPAREMVLFRVAVLLIGYT